LLVQEYVKDAQGKGLHCIVIDGRVVASIERSLALDEGGGEVPVDDNASAVKISQEERKMAAKAARILGLKVAGVDIIRSATGPLLLEVNSSPGLEETETITGKDIATSIIQSVEKHVNWNK
jgi:ribosomal protein S6--L-glutamate ligase